MCAKKLHHYLFNYIFMYHVCTQYNTTLGVPY